MHLSFGRTDHNKFRPTSFFVRLFKCAFVSLLAGLDRKGSHLVDRNNANKIKFVYSGASFYFKNVPKHLFRSSILDYSNTKAY